MDKISIIIPCYNEEKTIPKFYEEIEKVAKKDFRDIEVQFEYIFIDDGSNDNTLNIIKLLMKNDDKVKYRSFSRNFGKEAGMLAGLEVAKGNFVAIMDADLQDPPTLLKMMYDELQSGEYDCIATRRATRKGEPIIRSIFAKKFYKIINKFSEIEMVDGARDFRLMNRKMVDSILKMKEYNRYLKGIYGFVGFKTKWISYKNIQRKVGQTKWSFWKLLKYAMEAITSFTTFPLVISSVIGVFFFFISFILIIFIILKTLIYGDPTSGWPSMICVIFFVSGIQLFCSGIIGQYLAKVYLEVKKRPLYFIKEENIEK